MTRRRIRGVTLMESLSAGLISIIAAGVAVAGFIMIGRSFQSSEKEFRTAQASFKWAKQLAVDIESSKTATMPDANTLVLEYSDPIAKESHTTTYTIADNQNGQKSLTRLFDGEPDSRFSATLSSVTFELPSSSSVKYTYSAAADANREAINYTALVKMRNFK